MATKNTKPRNADAENAKKSGWGIDGDAGEDFISSQYDRDALISMYGMPLSPKGFRDPMNCSYDEEAASGSELLRNAREGNKPLLGRGDPKSPEQTGVRDKPRGNPNSKRRPLRDRDFSPPDAE